jgi:hypothetical protein
MPQRKTKPKRRIYPAGNPCPCGSDKVYGECCKRKKFRFEIDQEGHVRKTLKVHPRLTPILDETLLEFRSIFGRKPRRNDPIVFNHHLSGEEDFWQHARTIGKSADVREELIFAWQRSGFIVGEHSRDLMSDSDYEEWQDAMDEYFLLQEEGYDPFFVFTYLSGGEYGKYKSLVKLLDHVIIALGFALTDPKPLGTSANYFKYLLLGRSIRSLRTIREMYNVRYDDDCLAIARAVYEAYLRIKFLRCDPTSSERFEAMIAHELGAFPPKMKKNGQPNYSICVNPENGKEYAIVIANSEILKVSDFPLEAHLYYDLYPLLSGQVHPELVQHALSSIKENRADFQHKGDSIRAIVFILTISVLLLREVAECPFIRTLTRRDLLHVVKQLHKASAEFIATETMLGLKIVPASVYALFGSEAS